MKNTKGLFFIVILAGFAFITGCNKINPASEIELLVTSDSAFTNAVELQKSGDLIGARDSFRKIVIAQPTNALARLHYGILLQDVPPSDPYVALSQFEAYLVLSPDSEKKSLVEERIQKARQQISKRFDESLIIDHENKINAYIVQIRELNNKITALEKDIEIGKKLLAKSEEDRNAEITRNKRLNSIIDTLSSGGLSTQLPELSNANRSYTVKRGDTLWSLAREVYGDPNRNADIGAANGIKDGEKLVEGRVLIIP